MTRYLILPTVVVFALGLGAGWLLRGHAAEPYGYQIVSRIRFSGSNGTGAQSLGDLGAGIAGSAAARPHLEAPATPVRKDVSAVTFEVSHDDINWWHVDAAPEPMDSYEHWRMVETLSGGGNLVTPLCKNAAHFLERCP